MSSFYELAHGMTYLNLSGFQNSLSTSLPFVKVEIEASPAKGDAVSGSSMGDLRELTQGTSAHGILLQDDGLDFLLPSLSLH